MNRKQIYHFFKETVLRYLVLILFILLIMSAASCQTICTGQYQAVTQKGDTIVVPCENMVVMNLATFSDYYYARKNYDTLRTTIPKYKQMVDSAKLLMKRNATDMHTVIANQEQMLELESQSKEEAIAELVRVSTAYRRERKRNKWLKTITGGLGIGLGITLLSK